LTVRRQFGTCSKIGDNQEECEDEKMEVEGSMVLENRVLRLFGLKRNEVTGGWRKLQMRSFIMCTLCQI
jgi:hypothetical protein